MIHLVNLNAIAALGNRNQLAIIEAHLNGHLDLESDPVPIMAICDFFPEYKDCCYLWHSIRPILFGSVKNDKNWITRHCDIGEDFFLHFRGYPFNCVHRKRSSLETAHRYLDSCIIIE